jgi:EAL domain
MHVRAVTRLAIETDLRRAIDNDQLELHYQPIKWSKGDRIVGVEALVRWRRPDGALVLPGEFVPVAGETGLIRPIGRWVLHAAMDDFGTGSSSLSSLSQLPLDILKIDQSFVARLDQDPEGRAIVYAIISLATALGVRVTGEGNRNGYAACHADRTQMRARSGLPPRKTGSARRTGGTAPDSRHHRGHGGQVGPTAMRPSGMPPGKHHERGERHLCLVRVGGAACVAEAPARAALRPVSVALVWVASARRCG